MTSERIFLGVVRLGLHVPGSRSRKDRRQALHSLRDRILHRFDVTFHEIGPDARPGYQVVVLTTGGNDAALLRSTLDRVVGFVHSHPTLQASDVEVDVFRWEPRGWAARFESEEVDDA